MSEVNKIAYYDDRINDAEHAGNLMDEALTLQASMKNFHPEIFVVVFLSRTCRHCQRVKPVLDEFQRRHPDVYVETRYADESDMNTRMLEAFEGGVTEVPAAVVNGRFLVRKEKNFLFRLTYAISLAKGMGALEEDEEAWKLKI